VTRNRTIWLFDLVRGTSSRLTFDPSDNLNPTWSPDGRQIAFTSKRKGERELFLKASSGTGEEQPILTSEVQRHAEDWTRDGKYLIFNQSTIGETGIWALPMTGERKPFVVISGPGRPEQGQVSPNGKWIAYRSGESGRSEVYVQDFPPAGGKWQVSTAGGSDPQWGRDGKELFYIETSRMMAVDVKPDGARFDAGVPKPLFDTRMGNIGRNRYVVSPDSQRFLVVALNDSGLPIWVVQNWQAGLKR
jgi:Tol biopolymer transport system component